MALPFGSGAGSRPGTSGKASLAAGLSGMRGSSGPVAQPCPCGFGGPFRCGFAGGLPDLRGCAPCGRSPWGRNPPFLGAKLLRANYLNVRDLLGCDHVILPLPALEVVRSYLGGMQA